MIRRHPDFESKILGNRRNILVYLPPDYDKTGARRYPVLYMADGQNVFDGMTSYIPNQEWKADEAAEALIRSKLIEPIIIVAIDNGGGARADEYLPTKVKRGQGATWGGNADKFGKFVVDEIKPFVDKTYRTKTDVANTGFCGSSFGGIVTACIGLQYPQTFGKLAICSPSVWWDGRVVLKMVDAMPKKTSQRIWIDIGGAEAPNAVKDASDLASAYEKKGWTLGRDLAFYNDGYAPHNEVSWARRMPAILMFLFPART